jgi:hypothetical protein
MMLETYTDKEVAELAQTINRICDKNTILAGNVDLFKNQLLIILVNNGGFFKDLHYVDLTKVDFDKITLHIGNTSCRVVRSDTQSIITKWDELPFLKDKT